MSTTALIILDGYGYSTTLKGNAVANAKTPCMDTLLKKYPNTLINASGEYVGLPDGQMGNSEVGHLNLGAGRVVYQDITRIDKEIREGQFVTNLAFLKAIENCKEHNTALHLMGLLSDGGVHSEVRHLYELIKLAKAKGLTKVYIHCFLDGRDVAPNSAVHFIEELQEEIKKIGVGKIATAIGRYYIMDRDNRWDRVKKGYDMLMDGVGTKTNNILNAVKKSYEANVFDEFVEPIVLNDYEGVKENDSIIFFNFRTDRAREITRAVTFEDFDKFERETGYRKTCYVCMTEYDANFNNVMIAFGPKSLKNTLGEYLAKNGKTQARVAETEKYAHVTFFFNGGVETPNVNEKRYLIPSPKVATYDLQPEMSAYEVTDQVLKVLDAGVDVLILNFANCDMVGHTGKYDCAVKAVETVDECLSNVLDKILSGGGQAIVTADHGNAEKMLQDDGSVCTSHTTNPVPLVVVGDRYKDAKLRKDGKLADVAPTLLYMMEMPIPVEMEGNVLIQEK